MDTNACAATVGKLLLGGLTYLISKVDGIEIYRESSDYRKQRNHDKKHKLESKES